MVVEKHSKIVSEYPCVLISHNISQMKKHNDKPKTVNNIFIKQVRDYSKVFSEENSGREMWKKKTHEYLHC